MWVQSLGRDDLMEEELATHASILLRNPMDRGAWQATAHGVSKSRTQLSNFASMLFLGCLWLFQSEVPFGDPAHTFVIWISFS